jgi:nucleotide-binding universal stress UspA family protein
MNKSMGPPTPRWPPTIFIMSVVVGYVPDATGWLAVRQAAQEAKWRDAELVVVNVVDAAGFSRPTAADEKDLDAIAADLTAAGVTFSIRQIEQSALTRAEELLNVAEETRAELIVVGVKRTSAVVKAMLGSTVQRVVIGAQCPVLSVRAEE